MKVLISAYSCEPGRGSERGVGWNVACEVAKRHQVWVLTRPDESKAAIEAELAANPNPNLHFVYFTLPFWQDSMRLGQSGAMQIHYYLWQIQAYLVARRLHQEIGFDISHHVTFVKYSAPSLLSLLPIPFVWGSVGGGESAPPKFWKDFSLKARSYEIARDISRNIGQRDPLVKLTARRSTVVRSTTDDTAKRLYKMGASHVDIVPEVGLLGEEIAALNQYPLPLSQPVRFISMGRLLHWKGFHLGVQAFIEANLPDAEYWIVGDGPELESLKQIAQASSVAGQIKFWGRLPREETLERLGESHVLVHPSLHDSGGWVCVEAMASGRPVICLDLGGPAVQVGEKTGIKVSAQTPEQAVEDMAVAMRKLAADPALRTQMGRSGRQYVDENFSWTVVGERLDQLYQKTVALATS
ncbi:glycosyltransferase family 4 protein [cf. Phormidesmis sp. LEGE 11477]|uniref:glycosyltransferase family 4 protein n=1 Tax=cf. Phormidesmis sp. LEGE 11477 TaxID=1828680 RepID=UPI00187E9D3E|nr:glycosyltransferase family 4 protein [cf. Phormidesmis sp. LEGE 11477]MBE9061251.1 glycosyltransferase family 4 protein [cf. Phormidesmis sp. LEGE 11477]